MKSVTQANNLQKEPKREIVCDDKMNLRRDESESFAERGSEPVIFSRKRMIGPGLKTEQNLNRLEATWRPQASPLRMARVRSYQLFIKSEDGSVRVFRYSCYIFIITLSVDKTR